jgi:hypothetical protein
MTAIAQITSRMRTLAPPLAPVDGTVTVMLDNLKRGERSVAKSREILAAIAVKPEGMHEFLWRYRLGFSHYRLGASLAELGDEACLESVKFLRSQERFLAHARTIELMYALACGKQQDAMRLRRERALTVLTSRHEDQQLVLGNTIELSLLEASGDVLELQRMAVWFEERAARFEGWQPLAAIARARLFAHLRRDRGSD